MLEPCMASIGNRSSTGRTALPCQVPWTDVEWENWSRAPYAAWSVTP